MAMKRCPVCGEKYSDTYRTCPFCEEEEALRSERPVRRRGGKRSAAREDPGILTPMLVIVIVILAMTLAWLFFGDQIKGSLFPGGTPAQSTQSSQTGGDTSDPQPAASSSGASSGASSSTQPDPSGSAAGTEPDGTTGGASSGTASGELSVEQVALLPAGLTLSKTDFTIPVGDPPVKLTASGGSGSYTWYSEDDGIASVDENGTVTAISAGTINVYATDGKSMGLCIVRVKGGASSGGQTGQTGDTGTAPSGGEVKLNREDFTLAVGESFQLKSTGITATPTWSSSNPGVATVNGSGVVTGVSAGMTTVTMSYDGSTLTCIVRVK